MSDKKMYYFNSLALVSIVLPMLLSCEPSQPKLSCTSGTLVTVPARPDDWRKDVFTSTNIQAQAGNSLKFSASGTWDIGLGAMRPDGRDDWCECVISKAINNGFRGPVGALVGRIGENGKPFLIGSEKIIITDESGLLYLASNENMGPCNGTDRGSCYYDNRGTLDVCIQVGK